MVAPTLRVVVDGDSSKVYRQGDTVTGRVTLVVEQKAQIHQLKIVFAGSSTTKTTRPLHVNSSNTTSGRHEYEEKIRLFNREKELVSLIALAPKKYSWAFEFTFPRLTEQRFKRLTHGANYLREPHALPPSFQLKTNMPGGAAQISYFIQARLELGGSQDIKRCKQSLRYHPTPEYDVPREARVTSAILYDQQWKPSLEKEGSRLAVGRVLSRRQVGKSPRIVPCLSHPERIAPGQHIPLALSLKNARDSTNEAQDECILDSLSVTISTYSAVMCGHTLTQPEDIVSKHVTCIAKTDMNTPLPFGETKALTSNFRLVDDVECVPTFKTYTITRRYALNLSIGIKYGGQYFTIRSTTSLEIVPRTPRELLPPTYQDGDEIDPLPLYEPREPSKEFAPDYDSIYALSRTDSNSNSLSLVGSRSSSLFSGGSTTSTAASTPMFEIEQPIYERVLLRAA